MAQADSCVRGDDFLDLSDIHWVYVCVGGVVCMCVCVPVCAYMRVVVCMRVCARARVCMLPDGQYRCQYSVWFAYFLHN